jgi:hypothetical protein
MMKAKAAADVEYPAYGVTGPNKEISPTGDRRLAQSAQMYHYQHQKQQIIAMERYVRQNCINTSLPRFENKMRMWRKNEGSATHTHTSARA